MAADAKWGAAVFFKLFGEMPVTTLLKYECIGASQSSTFSLSAPSHIESYLLYLMTAEAKAIAHPQCVAVSVRAVH